MSYDPTKDAFSSAGASFSAQARQCAAVTPSDSLQLAAYAKALRVYVPGSSAATVKVTPVGAANDTDTVTMTFAPGVTIEPLAVRQVWATGTTAGLEIFAYTV